MRVAFAKPDYGIEGGLEFNLNRLARGLQERGHEVAWLRVDVERAQSRRSPYGIRIPDEVWERSWEFFRYACLVEAFREVDTSDHDVVISTQPPSFAIDHPHHLSLFYHHLRIYYDLSDVYVRAGFSNPDLHRVATQAIRRIDALYLGNVSYFLAGSETIRRRLETYNGFTRNVGIFNAGTPMDLASIEVGSRFEHILCVSRHEFPKRTELFVHAMKYLPELRGHSVGGGGRSAWVKAIDHQLSEPDVDLDSVKADSLWLCKPSNVASTAHRSNVRFHGHVPESRLRSLYRDALCVIAPAYLEDYGHTAIEAMAYGKPVVVCSDGGGLTEIVENEVTGLIVEPTGKALADAIKRLASDPDLARKLGANGREYAMRFTDDFVMEQLFQGIAKVMACR